MKKILLFVADQKFAGASEHVLMLAQGLAQKHWRVSVVASEPRLPRLLSQAGKRLKSRRLSLTGWRDKAALARLITIVHNTKPDAFHAHGLRAGWLASRVQKRLGQPFFYTEHLWTKDYKLPNPARERLQLFGLKRLCRRASRVVAVSQSVADFLVSKNLVVPDKVKVIYNAAPKSEIRNPKSETNSKFQISNFKFLSVGTLNKLKSFDIIIKALAELRQNYLLELTIYGEGGEKNYLQELARSLGVAKAIHWPGFVRPEKIPWPDYFAYCQASQSESFGLAIAAAMAAGLPVVASRVGGVPELVKDNQTGYLFAPNHPHQLAARLAKLYQQPRLARKMGAAGRRRVSKLFTVDKMLAEHLKIYNS